MKVIHPLLILVFFSNSSCGQQTIKDEPAQQEQNLSDSTSEVGTFNYINVEGKTIAERFVILNGYKRTDEKPNSFGSYLRKQKLLPHGSFVQFYDGNKKANSGVYLAVLDQEIGNQDLHQCADALMRLYASYHYENKNYDKIHFNFTNGWRCDFKKYAEGYRIKLQNNQTSWVKSKEPSYSEKTFNDYLIWIYKFCGTASLEKELIEVEEFSDLAIGDVLIKGGFPGHAVLIMDIIENEKGDKMFLLGQSYMPAQQMQILQNPMNPDANNPWYNLAELKEQTIKTPEWVFKKTQLKRFSDQ